jgi:hypothetical protein
MVRVGVGVGIGLRGVDSGGLAMLLGTCEVDGRLHLPPVMLGDCCLERVLQASDEEVDLMKLACDAKM